MPESSFPQVLGTVTAKERADKRWMAALFIGARFPPGVLTIDDAEACMEGDNEEILVALGKSEARKLGRNPDEITNVVWKTTRTIGLHDGLLATSGKFVVLRRNIHNVFESQSRFSYGVRNRNPYRYAIFAQSYEHALTRCPPERMLEINYDDLPGVIGDLLGFMEVADQGEWENGLSGLDIVAENCSWLTQVTEEFKNTDPEKRARLTAHDIRKLEFALAVTRPFRPFMGILRKHFDMRSIGHIRGFAEEVMRTSA